jgi:hypothetical protein
MSDKVQDEPRPTVMAHSQLCAFAKTREGTVLAHDDVVEQRNSKQLPGIAKPPCDLEILVRGLGVAARMVVRHDDSSSHLPKSWTEDLTRMHERCSERAARDFDESSDAVLSIEKQRDEAFRRLVFEQRTEKPCYTFLRACLSAVHFSKVGRFAHNVLEFRYDPTDHSLLALSTRTHVTPSIRIQPHAEAQRSGQRRGRLSFSRDAEGENSFGPSTRHEEYT